MSTLTAAIVMSGLEHRLSTEYLLNDRASRVRRRLFDDGDGEGNQRCLENQLACINRDVKRKYCFDFCTDKPLESHDLEGGLDDDRRIYQWKPQNAATVAATGNVWIGKRVQLPTAAATAPSLVEPMELLVAQQPNVDVQSEQSATTTASKRKQTKISDHFCRRKRLADDGVIPVVRSKKVMATGGPDSSASLPSASASSSSSDVGVATAQNTGRWSEALE